LKIKIGLQKISPSLSTQTISTYGTAPPSSILAAIQSTGRDGVLRGAGNSNSSGGTTSAVAILEIYAQQKSSSLEETASPVRGLVRMVQVAPRTTVCDVSLTNVRPGIWGVSVRQTGDVSSGAGSTGEIWSGDDSTNSQTHDLVASPQKKKAESSRRGFLGKLTVDESGTGKLFDTAKWDIWEVVGRGLVAERLEDSASTLTSDKNRNGNGNGIRNAEDQEAVVGVVARSAGVWDNDKTVCSCSGKTVWEERVEQRGRGIL
jgi:copper chaperone for superoxide dismutase